jgi:hypothetical protein
MFVVCLMVLNATLAFPPFKMDSVSDNKSTYILSGANPRLVVRERTWNLGKPVHIYISSHSWSCLLLIMIVKLFFLPCGNQKILRWANPVPTRFMICKPVVVKNINEILLPWREQTVNQHSRFVYYKCVHCLAIKREKVSVWSNFINSFDTILVQNNSYGFE